MARKKLEDVLVSLAFSPDGKLLAAADVDDEQGRVSLWKLGTPAGGNRSRPETLESRARKRG